MGISASISPVSTAVDQTGCDAGGFEQGHMAPRNHMSDGVSAAIANDFCRRRFIRSVVDIQNFSSHRWYRGWPTDVSSGVTVTSDRDHLMILALR